VAPSPAVEYRQDSKQLQFVLWLVVEVGSVVVNHAVQPGIGAADPFFFSYTTRKIASGAYFH
jgi:hypothetical protein